MESWKSYLEAQYIKKYSWTTITAFGDATFEYKKSLGLASKQSPMWKRGQAQVNKMANMLLGKLYIKEYFDPATKTKAKSIVEDVIAEFKENISSSKLFSQPTKDRAMKKINNMKFNIGYPDEWQNYDTLKIDKADLFGNYKRFIAYGDARYIAKLRKPVDKSEWAYAPQVLNAYYAPNENNLFC